MVSSIQDIINGIKSIDVSRYRDLFPISEVNYSPCEPPSTLYILNEDITSSIRLSIYIKEKGEEQRKALEKYLNTTNHFTVNEKLRLNKILTAAGDIQHIFSYVKANFPEMFNESVEKGIQNSFDKFGLTIVAKK